MTMLDDRIEVDLADGIYEGVPEFEGMIRHPVGALVASAIPVRPPTEWFGNPSFQKLEPLTIQSDGRVSGHIASWREDHIGMNGRVKAPRSKSGYAFFATGVLETAEGNLVNVGQITLTGGHASLEASVADAVAHYDNTQSAICDVSVGEDKHGIWVAGALRPTVDEHQLRAIRASSVSGDWRPINGNLEMVAVCAVNVPGFPIPRARVASGVPVALVAAGTGELVELAVHQTEATETVVATAFDDRLRFIEDVMLGKIGDSRALLASAIDAVREDTDRDARIAALRASVHPVTADASVEALRARVHNTAEAEVPVEEVVPEIDEERELAYAALRDRVHGTEPEIWEDDGMPIEYNVEEAFQASLRARAHGLVATGTATWTKDKRETAAKRGQALPGGRFPIKDCRDVEKAVRALGRAKGDKGKVKSHIKSRASSLGCMDKIPDGWK